MFTISVQNHRRQLSGNKLLAIILGTLFLAACSPKTTSVKKPTPTQTTTSTPDKEDTKGSKEVTTVKSIEKPEMVISLVLPFELDILNHQTATLRELTKAELAIDFYQGFKMGLDSAAHNFGGKFKLQVYDSKDNPAAASVLAAKAGIKNSDLIIGPIFPDGIKAFSVYSKSIQKLMVSPLAATSPETFNNPNLITINNSIEQHVDKAVDFIKSGLKAKHVLLIRSGQSDEYKYAVPFKKSITGKVESFSEIGIKAVGVENIFKHLNPIEHNVVVLPSTDRNFLLSVTKELEKLSRNFKISVIGHPSWEKLQFLDGYVMKNINAHITASYKIDYKTPRIDDFIKFYRSKFELEPGEYAFKGFDIGFYFGWLLAKNNKDFADELTKATYRGLHNNIRLSKNDRFGYYNSELLILKYQDFQLKRID